MEKKTAQPVKREWTAIEELEFEVRGLEMQAKYEREAIKERLAGWQYRLRRTADEIESNGDRMLGGEDQYRTKTEAAASIVNDLMWMMPNMGVQDLVGSTAKLEKLECQVKEAQAKLEVLKAQEAAAK